MPGQNLEEGKVGSGVAMFFPIFSLTLGHQPVHVGIATLCLVDESMWRAQRRDAEKEGGLYKCVSMVLIQEQTHKY